MQIKTHILNVLERCRIQDNLLFLPEQLDRKDYVEVNKVLDNIGGKWNRKQKAHVFEQSPVDFLDNVILTGEVRDYKKELQYFPTPKAIVQQMIEMAEIKPTDTVLEPSCGRGAIVEELVKILHVSKIYIGELDERNYQETLNKFKVTGLYPGDFLTQHQLTGKPYFDKIIQNPPFSKSQDILHCLHAFDFLKSGGILVSIVSESVFFREQKKYVEFRAFMEENDGENVSLEAGAFRESDTMVKTRIIKLKKL